jgi:ATP-dependent DNA ligase
VSAPTPPVEVMLARAVDRVPDERALPRGVQYEQKWDGYRAVAFNAEPVFVQSRRGADLTASFPEITAAVARLPRCVLDGELVIWGDGALDFPALLKRMSSSKANARRMAAEHPATFVIFDLLSIGNRDLRRQPLEERRAELETRLRDAPAPLLLSPATLRRDDACDWLDTFAAALVGIEGIVAKGLDQAYKGGEPGWLKYRYRHTVEVIVGAVTGTLTRPDRLMLGLYRDRELHVVGGTGSLSDVQQRTLAPLLVAAGDEHPWPDVIGGGYIGHWGGDKIRVVRVEPDVLVEVAADTRSSMGDGVTSRRSCARGLT